MRKIATKGVVALFNAIQKHQTKVPGDSGAKRGKQRSAKDVSKDSFLDMLKRGGGEGKSKKKAKTIAAVATKGESKDSSKTWNALNPDLMMGATLKDFDNADAVDEDM